LQLKSPAFLDGREHQAIQMSSSDCETPALQLVKENLEFARKLFGANDSAAVAYPPPDARKQTRDLFLRSKYQAVFQDSVAHYAKLKASESRKRPRVASEDVDGETEGVGEKLASTTSGIDAHASNVLQGVDFESPANDDGKAPASAHPGGSLVNAFGGNLATGQSLIPAASPTALALARDRPNWHAQWENFRVIMGHAGWVRSVAVEPENQWFATGSADRTIKIWDLASGKLKLTLTGHISAVRGIAISDRHPYMFSVGEDKMVKCWDLEQNKVVRHYHGHLSGIYTCALHPTLDLLMTAGRDAVVRVWDMRSRRQVLALQGHRDTINSVITQGVDPQVVSSSVDTTVRMWDLAAGKCMATLTNHKKGVRALAMNPIEFSFASASIDNIKTWAFPRGDFMRNLRGHTGLVNALAINQDGVLASGGNDGNVRFWDSASAHCFQSTQVRVQPGSMDNEAGIYAMAFDRSGSRLITCEADKTIKIWREDASCTPETHPLRWTPDLSSKHY
jgi:pleiotropic regulator 1